MDSMTYFNWSLGKLNGICFYWRTLSSITKLNCHTLVKTKCQDRIAIINLYLMLQNSFSITYLNWPSFVQPLQEDASTTRFTWTLILEITQLADCRSNSRSWLEDGESITFFLYQWIFWLTWLGSLPTFWLRPIDFSFKIFFLLL